MSTFVTKINSVIQFYKRRETSKIQDSPFMFWTFHAQKTT